MFYAQTSIFTDKEITATDIFWLLCSLEVSSSAFWVKVPCRLACRDPCLENSAAYIFRVVLTLTILTYPEDGSSNLLQNVGTYIQLYVK